MNRSRHLLVLPLLLAGCVPAPRIAAPHPASAPPLLAPAPPVVADWKDAAVEPGSWSYARDATGSTARFGPAGAAARFELRCDSATRRVSLVRTDKTVAAAMTVTTSYGARALPATIARGGLAAALPARDPLLDQIAFSRARFAIETPGLARLILPAWAEPTRVIEDCRG